MKRCERLVVVAALAMAVPFGCSKKQSDSEPSAPPPRKLAISYGPNFVDLATDISTDAIHRGFKVFSVAEGSESDLQGFDAFVICPGGKALYAADVPVFTIELDHRAGGRLAADAFRTLLDGKGKIAILDDPAAASSVLRIQGLQARFDELNTEEGVDLRVIAQLPGSNNPRQSRVATETILMAQGRLNGIYALNHNAALGARNALAGARKAGQVVLVSFSDTPDSELENTLVPVPENIASNTVSAIQHFFDEASKNTEIRIPMKLLRRVAP